VTPPAVTPPVETPPVETSIARLVERARTLVSSAQASGSRRALLGIAGAPGAGKSTLARQLTDALGPTAIVCGMDGFHLSNGELRRLGRAARKGALDTFDGHGYIALLHRLAGDPPHVVYAPAYDRSIEEAVAAAVAVGPEVRLVITEGNYLLVDQPPWQQVKPLADEVWFCELDDDVRTQRLVVRHIASGKTEPDARRWTFESDGANAELVAKTRERADLVIRLG
jgi:pantothenate kinase